MSQLDRAYDVTIVGAGPAGATLARLLSGQGWRILLVDRASSPDKCCGGLLAPDAQAMLSRLGLGLPREVLGGPQLFAVRAVDLATRRERLYQRFYFNLDRGRFDRWLLSLVPPEIEIRLGARFVGAVAEDRGRLRVQLHQGEAPGEIRTRLLVGADGAASAVRRACCPGSARPARYLAIQEILAEAPAAAWFHAFFPPPEITDDYAWAIPKDDGRLLLGAALPVHGAVAKFSRLKGLLAASGFPVDRPVLRREAALLLRPARNAELTAGAGQVALVGEAGGWVSPSSGEGISFALHSALLLADSLRDGPEHALNRYRRALRAMRLNLLGKRLKSGIIFSPALRGLLLRSGVAALAVGPGPRRS